MIHNRERTAVEQSIWCRTVASNRIFTEAITQPRTLGQWFYALGVHFFELIHIAKNRTQFCAIFLHFFIGESEAGKLGDVPDVVVAQIGHTQRSIAQSGERRQEIFGKFLRSGFRWRDHASYCTVWN